MLVVLSDISSKPSSPRKIKPSQPRSASTVATSSNSSALATPIATAFGFAGLASGPRILKTVGVANSLLALAAFFIAG